MKKSITGLLTLIILTVSLLFTGCSSSVNNNNVSKSESDIRELAYQYLNEFDKKSIIDWKSAVVEEIKYSDDYYVVNSIDHINIKGKDTYKLTFRTTNENMWGPITIYVDKKSYKILGIDGRD